MVRRRWPLLLLLLLLLWLTTATAVAAATGDDFRSGGGGASSRPPTAMLLWGEINRCRIGDCSRACGDIGAVAAAAAATGSEATAGYFLSTLPLLPSVLSLKAMTLFVYLFIWVGGWVTTLVDGEEMREALD